MEIMALSDQLTTLAAQAKSLEDSATAWANRTDAGFDARADKLKADLATTKATLAARVDDEKDALSDGWARAQKSMSNGFDSIRATAAEHRAKRVAAKADHDADLAELDAEDAVDFAIYALQEAEYSIVSAADARLRAEAVD
jgi:hypothetical protein